MSNNLGALDPGKPNQQSGKLTLGKLSLAIGFGSFASAKRMTPMNSGMMTFRKELL